jgi:hypothetical protein
LAVGDHDDIVQSQRFDRIWAGFESADSWLIKGNRMTSHIAYAELKIAIAEDRAAAAEALQRGLVATKPLSAIRIAELCELGEKMVMTGKRKLLALAKARRFADEALRLEKGNA